MKKFVMLYKEIKKMRDINEIFKRKENSSIIIRILTCCSELMKMLGIIDS